VKSIFGKEKPYISSINNEYHNDYIYLLNNDGDKYYIRITNGKEVVFSLNTNTDILYMDNYDRNFCYIWTSLYPSLESEVHRGTSYVFESKYIESIIYIPKEVAFDFYMFMASRQHNDIINTKPTINFIEFLLDESFGIVSGEIGTHLGNFFGKAAGKAGGIIASIGIDFALLMLKHENNLIDYYSQFPYLDYASIGLEPIDEDSYRYGFPHKFKNDILITKWRTYKWEHTTEAGVFEKDYFQLIVEPWNGDIIGAVGGIGYFTALNVEGLVEHMYIED